MTNVPPTAEPPACARCGAPFRCGTRDAGPCWCDGLKLERERLVELSRRYTGCLCPACLGALARTPDAR